MCIENHKSNLILKLSLGDRTNNLSFSFGREDAKIQLFWDIDENHLICSFLYLFEIHISQAEKLRKI